MFTAYSISRCNIKNLHAEPAGGADSKRGRERERDRKGGWRKRLTRMAVSDTI